jgi:hypothetical protein
MAYRKPLVLSTRTFDTHGDASAFFRAMLNRYEPGERVLEEDYRDLSALIEQHPAYATKVGCGIKYFEVIRTRQPGTHCFRIVRTDGTGTDISVESALLAMRRRPR